MGTEVRVGVVAGLLIVAVAGVYFFYGSSRDDEDLRIVTSPPTSEIPKIPAGRDDKSRPAADSVARNTPVSTPPAGRNSPTRTTIVPRSTAQPGTVALGTTPGAPANRNVTTPVNAGNPSAMGSPLNSPSADRSPLITPVNTSASDTTLASRTLADAKPAIEQSPLLPSATPNSLLRSSSSSELVEATRRNLVDSGEAKPSPSATPAQSPTNITSPRPAGTPSLASNATHSDPQASGTITLPPSLQKTPTDRPAPNTPATDRSAEPARTAIALNDPRNKPIPAKPAARDGADAKSNPVAKPIPTTAGGERTLLASTPAPKAEVWPKKHVIVQDDTVAALAAQYYGSTRHIQRILKANPNLDPRRMKIGDEVVIPSIDEAARPAEPANSAAPTPAAPASVAAAPRVNSASPAAVTTKTPATVKTDAKPASVTKTYTVRPGDTFYSIAQKTMGSSAKWSQLFERNKSVVKNNKRGLKAGMVLTIPG